MDQLTRVSTTGRLGINTNDDEDESAIVSVNGDEDEQLDAPPGPIFSYPDSSVTEAKQSSPRASLSHQCTISSHSLLAPNINTDIRKGPHIETITAVAGKASISMPPPLGKPSNDRRLSASLSTARFSRRSEDGISPSNSLAPGFIPTSPPASVRSLDERRQFTTSPQVSTTATDTTSITTNSTHTPGLTVLSPPLPTNKMPDDTPMLSSQPEKNASASVENVKRSTLSRQESTAAAGTALPTAAQLETLRNESAIPARAPRATASRSASNTRRLSRTTSKDNSIDEGRPSIGRVGVCALDVKARSRPSRQILTRLQSDDEFEVIVFGDKVILDEDYENWPICDFLISFFSDGFPLEKAIKYVQLRKPFLVNDLQMQKILWDRRLCLMILDQLCVPTPMRLEVTRDGGPRLESVELAKHVKKISGISLSGSEDGTGGGVSRTQTVELVEDGDALLIDGKIMRKPFVEKPVSGEDHNIAIYFPRNYEGGGARKLFRKVGNKSSEYVKDLIVPRSITEPESSYIYEEFLFVDNAEDVKAYTVGTQYCHAETRKSPVVDGLVRRNTHGKELRYVTKLNETERQMAGRIAKGFGQRICGFDLLRTGSTSYVIDVNGWSFVKDNEDYYNDCARILKSMFSDWKFSGSSTPSDETPPTEPVADGQPKKQSQPHSHRNALKTILKSPSMSRLSHLPHSRHYESPSGTSSPKGPASTISLTSPPVMDRGSVQTLPSVPKSQPPEMSLPAPASAPDVLESASQEAAMKPEEVAAPLPSSKHSWKLKGVVAVIRHADRTPKQKIKFTAHAPEFVDLLKGHHEEVLLKGEAALSSVLAAARSAIEQKSEDPEKLKNLSNALNRKIGQPDTKVQIKPMFKKRKAEHKDKEPQNPQQTAIREQTIPEHAQTPPISSDPMPMGNFSPTNDNPISRSQTRSDSISENTFSRYAAKEDDLVIDKMQLVMKWGGEPTHSARYQSQDLGAYMRDDWKLLNRDVLNDVRLFTSSEKRVKTSAQIWATAFLGQNDIAEDFIQVRKDLLDDSNAAKDVMDKVKKKLKHLLREGNSVPEQFAWPKDVPEPYIVMQNVVDLLKFHRRVMRHNFKKLQGGAVASLAALDSKDSTPAEPIDVSTIQARWCTGEDAELFKERWEKLFKEFCDSDKADPSKVSELYDTMKYDALHNKSFLEWIFTPSQSVIDEITKEDALLSSNASPEPEKVDEPSQASNHRDSTISQASANDKLTISQKLSLRRRSVLAKPPSTPPLMSYEQDASYFKLFSGSGESRSKQDKRLGRLRELYRYAKILFDYIGPQEYGISDDEKLEIGLLTSLPLLREIVSDLEELQASSNSASFIYFTKESHIYTLLNCIMEGGIHTKIKRATIPELDYLSQICFELYEAKDNETEETAYSIRISISPGCHTVDPLDVSLDSKHAIGTAPRRSLTNHQDWQEVITTLKEKFDTVQLPKSFLAVNVSDKHEQEARRASEAAANQKLEAGKAEALKNGETTQQDFGGPAFGSSH